MEKGCTTGPRRDQSMGKRHTCTSEWRTTRDTRRGSGFHQTIAVVLPIARKLVIACVIAAMVTASATLARSTPAPASEEQTELLSAQQGEALVQFAINSGAHLRGKPDCSHLVHLLYSRAGLKYTYQPSRALYRGTADFGRVNKPQPGDLIVWRGHVGIVVSPAEKIFFSSVRSGIVTESWTADQWRARGRPRFYRYRLGPNSNPEMLARLASDDEPPHSDASSKDPEDQTSSPSEVADASTEPPVAAPKSASVLALIRQHKRPGKKEIEAAFVEAARANAQQLLDADNQITAIAQDKPVAIFTRAEVQKIRVKHDKASVTIRLTESVAIEQGRVWPGRTLDHEFLMQRTADGNSPAWLLTDPQQQTYVPAANGLSVFQHCAELMLHNDPNSSATRAVIKALDLLYSQPPSSPQRTALK